MLTAQTEEKHLLGICTRADLNKEPYSEWFVKNYDDYKPNPELVKKLKNCDFKNYTITLFLGTWCGDSHREVPRFLKLLDEAGFPQQAVTMVALSDKEAEYKQSPTHEEQGKHIYRVPTFIVSKNGNEINRIIEFPVKSLEYDLLAILKNEAYTPNYRSYAYLSEWFDEGSLSDDNISYAGLANQIRGLPRSVGELDNFGYVLLKQGNEKNLKAAVKVFQISTYLYPDSYWSYSNLATALSEIGKNDEAGKMIQRALELNSNSQNIKYLLEQYDIVRGKVE
jgi:tetratricopeptide (TPR) repeat protein